MDKLKQIDTTKVSSPNVDKERLCDSIKKKKEAFGSDKPITK